MFHVIIIPWLCITFLFLIIPLPGLLTREENNKEQKIMTNLACNIAVSLFTLYWPHILFYHRPSPYPVIKTMSDKNNDSNFPCDNHPVTDYYISYTPVSQDQESVNQIQQIPPLRDQPSTGHTFPCLASLSPSPKPRSPVRGTPPLMTRQRHRSLLFISVGSHIMKSSTLCIAPDGLKGRISTY